MMKMKRVTKKILLVLVFVFTFTIIAGTNTTVSKAYEEGDVVASFTYADGITRNLVVKEDGIYSNDHFIGFDSITQIGYDKYGTIWVIDEGNLGIIFYSPYIQKSDGEFSIKRIPYYVEDDGGACFFELDSLLFDASNKVIGFKTVTGDEYLTLDLEKQIKLVEDVNKELDVEGGAVYLIKDYSTYIPEGYVAPTPTSNVTPTPTPDSSAATPVTPVPLIINQSSEDKNSSSEGAKTTTSSTKASIKTEKGYKVYYKGDTVVGKYKLKKNVLTYKGKKYKKVKKAFFIKKDGNVVFLDKNKKAYLLKGKKKKLLLKGAKKIVTSGGFAVKVKGKSKTISVKNCKYISRVDKRQHRTDRPHS